MNSIRALVAALAVLALLIQAIRADLDRPAADHAHGHVDEDDAVEDDALRTGGWEDLAATDPWAKHDWLDLLTPGALMSGWSHNPIAGVLLSADAADAQSRSLESSSATVVVVAQADANHQQTPELGWSQQQELPAVQDSLQAERATAADFPFISPAQKRLAHLDVLARPDLLFSKLLHPSLHAHIHVVLVGFDVHEMYRNLSPAFVDLGTFERLLNVNHHEGHWSALHDCTSNVSRTNRHGHLRPADASTDCRYQPRNLTTRFVASYHVTVGDAQLQSDIRQARDSGPESVSQVLLRHQQQNGHPSLSLYLLHLPPVPPSTHNLECAPGLLRETSSTQVTWVDLTTHDAWKGVVEAGGSLNLSDVPFVLPSPKRRTESVPYTHRLSEFVAMATNGWLKSPVQQVPSPDAESVVVHILPMGMAAPETLAALHPIVARDAVWLQTRLQQIAPPGQIIRVECHNATVVGLGHGSQLSPQPCFNDKALCLRPDVTTKVAHGVLDQMRLSSRSAGRHNAELEVLVPLIIPDSTATLPIVFDSGALTQTDWARQTVVALRLNDAAGGEFLPDGLVCSPTTRRIELRTAAAQTRRALVRGVSGLIWGAPFGESSLAELEADPNGYISSHTMLHSSLAGALSPGTGESAGSEAATVVRSVYISQLEQSLTDIKDLVEDLVDLHVDLADVFDSDHQLVYVQRWNLLLAKVHHSLHRASIGENRHALYLLRSSRHDLEGLHSLIHAAKSALAYIPAYARQRQWMGNQAAVPLQQQLAITLVDLRTFLCTLLVLAFAVAAIMAGTSLSVAPTSSAAASHSPAPRTTQQLYNDSLPEPLFSASRSSSLLLPSTSSMAELPFTVSASAPSSASSPAVVARSGSNTPTTQSPVVSQLSLDSFVVNRPSGRRFKVN
ncbi:hypothetical protein CAOG_04317 [Capsaspora owczarzaki ATCC 30864]|uniref:Uncharacterized protein n=1 Tax=Capsaspora owczarzaki (strain ATCC 30864) TaxID=595528 RepID=A0A0D2UEK3_CAPO3|nr:hypothetical protein CAOG_04317 [Capsaspora owczarzaki ATCC 30864]KJE93546.1 hypothetical protein CAOG_004317 [Capsaspora owczarzaki ATCC 30864]|eukprot:XP_004348145.1 hypothetical protein CAOG_04317 [Capsaspora owczarzaki ATCC 30864]